MKLESPDECDPKQPEFELVVPDYIEDELLKTRRIQLIGEINEGTAAYVNTYLRIFAISDPSLPVFIYISSPGGDLSSGYSIVDQIELSPFETYTIVHGQAYSMGAIVAAFGTKGCRFITRNSSIMIHQPMLSSNPEYLGSHKKAIYFVDKNWKSRIQILAKRTNWSYKKFSKKVQETLWMNAVEATNIGIVDGIWDSEKEEMVNKLAEQKS